MKREALKTGWLKPQAVYGYFPVGRDGDDIVVFEDEARTRQRARFHTLRQQQEERGGLPYLALADSVAGRDYLGAFVVTAGVGADELALVLSILVVHDDDHPALAEVVDDVGHRAEFKCGLGGRFRHRG